MYQIKHLSGIVGMAAMLLFLSSCSSVPKDPQVVSDLRTMTADTVAELAKTNPELKQSIESAPGYLVADMKVTKVPVFGAGVGRGLIYTKGEDEEVYFKVTRMDFGGGWGIKSFKVLVVMHNAKELERAKNGRWIFQFGAEVTAGTAAIEGGSESIGTDDYDVYYLTDLGASATITGRMIRMSTSAIKPPAKTFSP